MNYHTMNLQSIQFFKGFSCQRCSIRLRAHVLCFIDVQSKVWGRDRIDLLTIWPSRKSAKPSKTLQKFFCVIWNMIDAICRFFASCGGSKFTLWTVRARKKALTPSSLRFASLSKITQITLQSSPVCILYQSECQANLLSFKRARKSLITVLSSFT